MTEAERETMREALQEKQETLQGMLEGLPEAVALHEEYRTLIEQLITQKQNQLFQ